jgi:DNA helicase-2/ATP-dependent DNA helicase PcrA
VNAANSLIKKNVGQIFKNVFSKQEEGEKIEVISAFSDFEEGLIVANKIARMRYEDHASYGDFAILYRTNAQSRIFEEALRKKNIPYRIYGGLSFYQRKEIKDIIGYFRLIVNPQDEEAFRRVINYPARGIGNVTVGKISNAAQSYNTSMWEVLSKPLEYNLNVNSGMLKKLSHFHELISDLIEQNEKLNAFELAQQVIKKTGIATETYRDMTPEGMSRAENIQELLNAMNIFVTQRQEEGNDNISLSDFLSEVSLLTDQDTDSDSDSERVTLMTVHSAKGLEFDHVFVVGMEEDLFPVVMAKNEMQGLEEERRLFYVAITRAKKTCTLTYAKSRFKNGRVISTRESRFLIDIDRKFLLTHGDTFSDVCSEHGDGFWSSLRHQKDEMTNARNQKPVYSSQQEKFSPVTQTSFQPLSKEAEELCEGDIIEHERFGRGVVSEIESSGNDKRAFVDFDSAGRKQLLLKFAKFKIVK